MGNKPDPLWGTGLLADAATTTGHSITSIIYRTAIEDYGIGHQCKTIPGKRTTQPRRPHAIALNDFEVSLLLARANTLRMSISEYVRLVLGLRPSRPEDCAAQECQESVREREAFDAHGANCDCREHQLERVRRLEASRGASMSRVSFDRDPLHASARGVPVRPTHGSVTEALRALAADQGISVGGGGEPAPPPKGRPRSKKGGKGRRRRPPPRPSPTQDDPPT